MIKLEDIIFDQENDYNCGVVCLQWIMYKKGFHFSQRELEKQCGTSAQGTSHKGLKKFLIAHSLPYLDSENNIELNIEGLREALKNGYQVMVGWTPWDEHYSIVEKIGKDTITLNDPGSPSCISIYSLEEFKKVWFDSEKDERVDNWSLVVL